MEKPLKSDWNQTLSLFQGNPQISDLKPDFRNSFTKQTQHFPCTCNTQLKGAETKQKRYNETDTATIMYPPWQNN